MLNFKERRTAPPELIQHAKTQIHDVITNARGVHFIMLCTTDGFELASIHKKDHYNTSKLAAVSSSILAMVTAFIQEIQLKGCQSITLDAENGKAILTSVTAPRHPMIIVTLAEKDILLGQVLYMLKNASQSIIDDDQKYNSYSQ